MLVDYPSENTAVGTDFCIFLLLARCPININRIVFNG
jgi:hypothetical protein